MVNFQECFFLLFAGADVIRINIRIPSNLVQLMLLTDSHLTRFFLCFANSFRFFLIIYQNLTDLQLH